VTNPLFDPDARLVVAHRGNSAHAPENTLEALRQAIELGADAVEFDVRVTRDGVPVLMHDARLERTTSGLGLLAEMNSADVRALDASRGLAAWSGPRVAVPTLELVLDQCRETPLVIEVKEPRAVAATVDLLHRMGRQGSVVVASEDAETIQALSRSGLRTCASRLEAILLVPLALAGLTPHSPDYALLSITPRYRGWSIPVVRMAAAARRRGIPTHVWTVNDAAQALALWNGGVAGIVSDDPAAMLRARPR
jgi:glycerophosphoryl diester phosphodiesterase